MATPRFDPWSRVDISGGPEACWPWTARQDDQGYGMTKINGRQWRAARWVLTQKLGRELTADEVTRHTCDNPPCVNPAHLIVGSPADNIADMIGRGRHVHGDQHWTRRDNTKLLGAMNPASKLTADDVRAIRAQYAEGATQVALAERFGITQAYISQIVRRRSWAHIN